MGEGFLCQVGRQEVLAKGHHGWYGDLGVACFEEWWWVQRDGGLDTGASGDGRFSYLDGCERGGGVECDDFGGGWVQGDANELCLCLAQG